MANITDYGMPRPLNRVFKNQTRATRIGGLVMNSNNLFQRPTNASNTLQGLEND